MTRGGKIEYNFHISPYTFKSDKNITFVFSSDMHLQKFKERQKEHREKIAQSLSSRFNVHIKADVIADLMLYTQIEKRGFLIKNSEGVEFSCLKNIKLNGEKLTLKRPGIL